MNERINELELKVKYLKKLLKLLAALFTILGVICSYIAFSYHQKTKRINLFLNKLSVFETHSQPSPTKTSSVKPVDIEIQSNSNGFTAELEELKDFDIEIELFRYAEASGTDRLFQRNDYDRAIMGYQKLIANRSTRDVVVAHSIFFQASSFRGLGDNDTAKVIYKKLIRKFPRTKYAQKATIILKTL